MTDESIEFKVAAGFSHTYEAHLYKSRLESEGIDCDIAKISPPAGKSYQPLSRTGSLRDGYQKTLPDGVPACGRQAVGTVKRLMN